MIAVPPFDGAGVSNSGDGATWFFTKQGAYELVRRIRDAWRMAGWDILVWVEPSTRFDGRKEWVVRSDLVNGLPRANTPRWGAMPDPIESGGHRRRMIAEMEG